MCIAGVCGGSLVEDWTLSKQETLRRQFSFEVHETSKNEMRGFFASLRMTNVESNR
jgi:hypothetical protein